MGYPGVTSHHQHREMTTQLWEIKTVTARSKWGWVPVERQPYVCSSGPVSSELTKFHPVLHSNPEEGPLCNLESWQSLATPSLGLFWNRLKRDVSPELSVYRRLTLALPLAGSPPARQGAGALQVHPVLRHPSDQPPTASVTTLPVFTLVLALWHTVTSYLHKCRSDLVAAMPFHFE